MDYQVTTLANGIRLLVKPSVSSVSHACIIVNAGSRDEREGKDGLAHFIEHLLFKRTEKRSTNQILNLLESVGGDLNAYTTKEYTCIHASFMNAHLERALDLFQDLIFHSTFPGEEMDKEKGVILDEIASYEDQPEEAIQDDFEDMVFSGHPLGRNILGTVNTVPAFTRDDIATYIAENYRTDAIIVGVTGNYDLKWLARKFEKFFGAVPANPGTPGRVTFSDYRRRELREQKPINQVHCMLGNEAYSLYDPRKTGLLLLNNILGGQGMTSRLNLEIRERYGIAYTIESSYTPMADTGLFSIYFGTDAEKAERALTLTHRELRKLRETKLGLQVLHRAREKFKGQIALSEENRLGVLISMCKSVMDYGKADTLDEIFAKIDAVTGEQLLEIANEVFQPDKLSLLSFEPEEHPE
jgi:predicted Zn-dependent peptidase